ncbi:FAD-binding oxidoreductase [Nonomuraea sp. MTCD27]|uniref:FAD-binding oxidoreductase n=1 Tax=Nonomuraea sp. MTCD27 TaxID=1676747 RepID=UPI0035C1C887
MTRSRRPAADDWQALRRRVRGPVLLPGDPGYEQARRIADPRFGLVRPLGVVRCADPRDVREAVLFARRHRLPPHPRSGGHGYAGYSTGPGLVIDVSPMSGVTVDQDVARVGAGARAGEVARALDRHDRLLPLGTCPDVGIAGLTLGGGIGTVGRAYGLTMDHLLQAEVVLADGRMETCGPDAHADLFFALRGAGTAGFGIVTSLVFGTHPAPDVHTFLLEWPWAPDLVAAWQEWALTVPDRMFTQLVLRPGPGQAVVVAVWCGPRREAAHLLVGLTRAMGTGPAGVRTHSSRYPEATEFLWCFSREGMAGASGPCFQADHLLDRPLPPEAVAVLTRALARGAASEGGGRRDCVIELQGGALGRAEGTAWAHRDCRFGMWVRAWADARTGLGATLAARDWTARLWQDLRPWATGQAYQNHVSARQPDWGRAYYGEHLDRLRAVKARYDPGDLFHFPHAIRPPRPA